MYNVIHITPFFVKYCISQLGFSANTASLGLFVLTIAGAVFAVPAGILSDRINRRFVLLSGTIIFAVGMTLAVLVKNVVGMYLLLALIGVGFICIQVTIYAILAEIAPANRLGEFMGIMNLFISLSQWIATLVMGYLLDSAGFGFFFPIAAAIMGIAVILIFFSKFDKAAEVK